MASPGKHRNHTDDHKEGLNRRYKKQGNLLRNWFHSVSRQVQLNVIDLPEQDKNKVKMRGDPPAAFSLQIVGIDDWPLHRTFVKSLKKAKNDLLLSIHVSFFHLPSNSFFGRTWQSQDIEIEINKFRDGKDATFRSASQVVINEVIYWYTFVDDPRTAIVIELVASEYDQTERVCVNRVSCGWTILSPSPFGHRGLLGGDDPLVLDTLPIFNGTPRSLTMCGASSHNTSSHSMSELMERLTAGRVEGVEAWHSIKPSITFRVAHFPSLLRARNLIVENEIVGYNDVVTGLTKRRVGDNTGSIQRLAVIGSKEVDSHATTDYAKVRIPALKVRVSRSRIAELSISKIVVRVQDSATLEAALSRHFDWSLRDDETKVAAHRRITSSGVTGLPLIQEMQLAEKFPLSNPCTIGFKLIAKRLRFMCHNGRTFTSLGSSVPLQDKNRTISDREGNGAPVSELTAEKASKVWTPGALWCSPCSALIVFLEYVVRPHQNGLRLPGGEPADEVERENWIDANSSQVTVVIGCAQYLPWDGKLFRLRSSYDPRLLSPIDGSPNKFELPLSVDPIAYSLCSQRFDNPLFWPPPGADELMDGVRGEDRDKPLRYVKFTCSAMTQPPKESSEKAKSTGDTLDKVMLEDQTPSPTEELNMEGEEKEGDENSDSSASSDSSSDEESVKKPSSPKRRTHRPKPEVDVTSLGETLIVKVDTPPPSPDSPRSLETASSDLWFRSGIRAGRGGMDTPEDSPREIDRTTVFGRQTSSLLAQTLQAPLGNQPPQVAPRPTVHFGDVPGPAPSTTRMLSNFPAQTTLPQDGRVHELSRASRARLDMGSSMPGMSRTSTTTTAPSAFGLWGAPNLSLEMADSNCLNAVFIRFLAFRGTSPTSPIPQKISFSFRFFDKPPRRTPSARVGETSGRHLDNSKPHPIIYEGGAGGSGLEERVIVDVSEISTSEAFDFFTYLGTRKLQIDVWDGDSLILLGTASVPLRPLLREQKNSVQVALEYDILSPRDGEQTGQEGSSIGRIQISLTNYGGKGKGNVAGTKGPVQAAPHHEPVGPFNWRFVNDGTGPVEGSRPAHRKRARPLVSGNGTELKHAVSEITRGEGGGLTNSGTEKWSEGATISYDELTCLAKRFRAQGLKGYVAYRGPLIQLLDAPSVIAAEKSLVTDLARLEERGGKTLEAIAQLLDRNKTGFIPSQDLLMGLKSLCPASFGRLRPREANMLAGRIERGALVNITGINQPPNNGGVSVLGLVGWVRARQGGSDVGKKLERLFRMFEKVSGVSVSEIVHGSLSAHAFITAIRSLQQTIGSKDITGSDHFLSESSLQRFVEKKGDKNDMLDVSALLTSLGLIREADTKGASKEAKLDLSAALSRIGEKRIGKYFESWMDSETCLASIDAVLTGLSKFGLVRQVSVEDARLALVELASEKEGGFLLCSDLFKCVDWSWETHIKKALHVPLVEAETMGTGLADLIGQDIDLSLNQLQEIATLTGKALPRHIPTQDIDQFLTKLKNARISILEFAAGAGNAWGGATLKRLLLSIEASGTLPIHQVFKNMDQDGNGSLSHEELIEGLRQGLEAAKLPVEVSKDVSDAIKSLETSPGQGIPLHNFMDIVGRPFANYLEARLEAIIRTSNIDLSSIFQALDKDGDGTVTAEEMGVALKEIKGFEDATDQDVKELLSRFDPDGSGTISLIEFSKVMGQHFKATDTEAMFVKLMGRAVKLGFSLRQCFDELDHSGDGTLDAQELQTGLVALGGSIPMFKDVSQTDIVGLVSHISGGGDTVTRDAFLTWGKTHKLGDEADLATAPPVIKKLEVTKKASTPVKKTNTEEANSKITPPKQDADTTSKMQESKMSDRVDNEQEEESKASREEQDILTSDFCFSSDPFTATTERKLRKAAQTFQSRAERLGGWCDVEELFTRYDQQGVGSVLKSEFVNILMQLGLSLVDIPGSAQADSMANTPDNERRRRLAQISRVKGGVTDMTARLRAREGGGTGGKGDEELALIKWYREGQKKGMVKSMVESGVKSEYHIFPRFGSSVFFEHPLVNPFNCEERLLVEIEGGSGLTLVSNFEEWVHFRRHVSPPPGFPALAASIEPDMFAVDRGGAQLLVGSHETVPLPLSFLSVSEVHMAEEHTCVVKLISAKHGVVVALVQVHVHPRAPIVHRTLRFNQGEGSIVKRHIRLPPEDSGKFIAPVEFGEKRVVVESRVAADGCQEIGIKYAKLGAFPSSGDFYLLIFEDEYRSKLYELWHVVVSSRLRKDVHGTVGVTSSLELVVRGDRQERLVRAFSSSSSEISFTPNAQFVLHPGVYNQINLNWVPKEAGSTLQHVHLVDTESAQLVVAYLLSTVATPPQVSKEFDVDVVVGEPSHKRVSYNNPWSRSQSYTLRSSDQNRMRPKSDRLHIAAHGQAYIRLYLSPVEHPGVSEVFLLVNDEQDQNDECFRIIIHAE